MSPPIRSGMAAGPGVVPLRAHVRPVGHPITNSMEDPTMANPGMPDPIPGGDTPPRCRRVRSRASARSGRTSRPRPIEEPPIDEPLEPGIGPESPARRADGPGTSAPERRSCRPTRRRPSRKPSSPGMARCELMATLGGLRLTDLHPAPCRRADRGLCRPGHGRTHGPLPRPTCPSVSRTRTAPTAPYRAIVPTRDSCVASALPIPRPPAGCRTQCRNSVGRSSQTKRSDQSGGVNVQSNPGSV